MSESEVEIKDMLVDNSATNVENINSSNATAETAAAVEEETATAAAAAVVDEVCDSSLNDSQNFSLNLGETQSIAETKNDEEGDSKSQDEIIEGTPPHKDSHSPLKRPFDHQNSGVDDSDDEPSAKIPKYSSDVIIPETQDAGDDENASQEASENVIKPDENVLKDDDDVEEFLSTDNVDNESFQALSQALERVLEDKNQMDVDAGDKITDEKPENEKIEQRENEQEDKDEEKEESVVVIEEKPDEKEQIEAEKVDEKIEKDPVPDPKPINELNNDAKNDNNEDTIKSQNVPDDTHVCKKSRMSIEIVYEASSAPPSEPKEIVELDEDDDKMILDSSQVDSSDPNASSKPADNKTFTNDANKTSDNSKESTDSKLINGSTDSSKSSCDRTASLRSDLSDATSTGTLVKEKQPEFLNLVSDSEGESFTLEDKSKLKTIPVEKEINVLVKVKCLLHVDETSKELANKEILAVYCESFSDFNSLRRRNSDTSQMADISDNKDPTSPGSVASNPQPFPLIPSRLSLMSLVSSSSSSSSGSAKFPTKENPFSLPRGVPKHAKKIHDMFHDDVIERLKKEWKNINLIPSTVINFINGELMTTDLHNGTNEQGDNTLERFRSSTPETSKVTSDNTKSGKKGKVAKRTKGQSGRASKTNGVVKTVTEELSDSQENIKERKDDDAKPSSSVLTPSSRSSARSLGILRSYTPVYDPTDALIGKKCFAKWSDNNYYPGTVISKSKGKFKINFLDGKYKLLIEEFFIPINTRLPVNLSVYATTKNDDYGSCGIITEVIKNSEKEEEILYAVETDEGEHLKVQIKDIFLTSDQAQILKETINDDTKSPSHLEKGSLNDAEGSRRTKSSLASTPRSSRGKSRGGKLGDVEASGSGSTGKIALEDTTSDSDGKLDNLEDDWGGIQPEIIGTSIASTTKGPQSRVKGKGRSKKKVDDPETINLLGPIPTNNTLFCGMSFILTCASLESLDKYKTEMPADSNSELGTDYEEEWTKRPFIRDRLVTQITAGGGKIYSTFEEIPRDDYPNVKLITNIPNVTAKSLLCLSCGITPYSHQWIIRCCQENKLLNLNAEALPAGWSLDKKSYIEMHKRPSNKPFEVVKIVIPKTAATERSLELWKKVIENAGGTVQIIESPSDNFVDGMAVLTNSKCPNWVQQKSESWNIPLLSSTWIIQCLIEGIVVAHDSQPAYSYNYFK